jgi:hypothetical protein
MMWFCVPYLDDAHRSSGKRKSEKFWKSPRSAFRLAKTSGGCKNFRNRIEKREKKKRIKELEERLREEAR